MSPSLIPTLVAIAAGALLSCAPVPASSTREPRAELPAGGLPTDGGAPEALGAPGDTEAFAASSLRALSASLDADLDSTTPELPAFENHEPAIAPRALPYECRLPAVSIPKAQGCGVGGGYPRCRWQLPLPRAAGRLYTMWRNTTEDRWWGRPALVGVLLAAAREFERLHPEQALDIGDLDAAGPRHATHDRGVDVDIYLRGAMVTENEGAGQQPWNYWDQDPRQIETLRWRVEELARILATCTEGKLRIYYNDPVVEQRFHAWFREQGYRSPFGPPMQPHNELHQFHFHVTVADDAAVPPRLRAHPMAASARARSTLASLSPQP